MAIRAYNGSLLLGSSGTLAGSQACCCNGPLPANVCQCSGVRVSAKLYTGAERSNTGCGLFVSLDRTIIEANCRDFFTNQALNGFQVSVTILYTVANDGFCNSPGLIWNGQVFWQSRVISLDQGRSDGCEGTTPDFFCGFVRLNRVIELTINDFVRSDPFPPVNPNTPDFCFFPFPPDSPNAFPQWIRISPIKNPLP